MLEPTGFVLKSGQSSTITAPSNWNGRFWAELSARLTPPPEISPASPVTAAPGSLVDGYNVPMVVIPVGGSSANCSSTGCPADLNAECPIELHPETCKPSVYANIFKTACPDAYSYAYDDDAKSTFTCSSADYNITTFCPASNNARLDIRFNHKQQMNDNIEPV
ncbi:Thaumatin family [Sesbania bispinosa]|nr:Thaumatin family [Sesbania bispinosa]